MKRTSMRKALIGGEWRPILTPSERSAQMSLIRSGDTKPEKRLRSALHRAGFRFRLHDRSLPGTPDIRVPESQEGDLREGVFLASPQMS